MDEDLARLARELDLDPTNEVAARRYQAALLRAGRRDEVLGLFRFKFRCPVTFEDLEPTSAPDVRFCGECRRNVYRTKDEAALRDHVSAGECVALETPRIAAFLGTLPDDPRFHVAREPRPPCVITIRLIHRMDPLLCMLVPRDLAREMRIVPVGWMDNAVIFATDHEREDADRVAMAVDFDFHSFEIVPKDELEEALDRYPERPDTTLRGAVRLVT